MQTQSTSKVNSQDEKIKAESLLTETKALATQNEKRNTKSMCEDGRNISD